MFLNVSNTGEKFYFLNSYTYAAYSHIRIHINKYIHAIISISLLYILAQCTENSNWTFLVVMCQSLYHFKPTLFYTYKLEIYKYIYFKSKV